MGMTTGLTLTRFKNKKIKNPRPSRESDDSAEQLNHHLAGDASAGNKTLNIDPSGGSEVSLPKGSEDTIKIKSRKLMKAH